MELNKEYIIKIVTIVFCLVMVLEISIYFFIYNKSNQIFEQMFNDTLAKSAEKTKETMDMMRHFISNLIMYYMTKLKLISKHTVLFNGKNNTKDELKINRNSKLFKNKNLRDKIIEAKTNDIYNKKPFKDVFNNETG